MRAFFHPDQLAHAPALEMHNGGFTAYAEKPERVDAMLYELQLWMWRVIAEPVLDALGFAGTLPYVHGSTIDYIDQLTGAGFQVNNPNVVAACGCGSSFRVPDEEEVSAV